MSHRGLSGRLRRTKMMTTASGPDQERHPPALGRPQRIEQQEGGERAEDGPEPVRAVDPDIGAPAVACGHHLVDRRVDSRVLTADARAGDEPCREEVEDPVRSPRSQRHEAGADQVDRQGPHEQVPAPELVGQPPEHQCPHDFADEVDGADGGRLRRGQVKRVGLGELAAYRTGDRDRQAIKNPGGAEAEDQAGVERRPAQAVEPGRDRAPDRLLLLRDDGGHAGTSLDLPRSAGGLVVGLLDAGAVTRDEHDGALGFEKDVLADRPGQQGFARAGRQHDQLGIRLAGRLDDDAAGESRGNPQVCLARLSPSSSLTVSRSVDSAVDRSSSSVCNAATGKPPGGVLSGGS